MHRRVHIHGRLKLPPALLILAAGLGTRFGGDKPLAHVTPDGAALLDFAIFDAARAGFGAPIIVVRPELESVLRNHLFEQFGSSLQTRFVHQDTPLGTGHALLCAAESLNRPFAVANADDFYGQSSYQALFRCMSQQSADSCVTVYRLADTLSPYGGVSRAVCRADARGLLSEILEVLDIRSVGGQIRGRTASGAALTLTGDEAVSMSLWGLQPEFVPALRDAYVRFGGGGGEFRLSDAADTLVRQDDVRVRMIRVREAGFGITFAEDVEPTRARIERLIERGDYPARFSEVSVFTEEA